MEPVEERILGNMDELMALLREREGALRTRKPEEPVKEKSVRELRQSVELLAELFTHSGVRPSTEMRTKVVALADSISSLLKTAGVECARVLAEVPEDAKPSDLTANVELLGFPSFMTEMLPDIIAVLGRAVLRSEGAQPLGTLAGVLSSEEFVSNVAMLQTRGRGAKKPKVSDWHKWQVEAGTAARVHELVLKHVVVATLAGQRGLESRLPQLCTQMVAWGRVSDWFCLLCAEEGDAAQSAWNVACAGVKQLSFAGGAVDNVLAFAEATLMEATAETAPDLVQWLLRKFEHNPALDAFLGRRAAWPAVVSNAVEELAPNFPGVALLQSKSAPCTPDKAIAGQLLAPMSPLSAV